MSTKAEGSSGRRRITAAQRRSRLLDVGAELFAAKPYDDVSMEEVAAQGAISRALLYRHFPSKRDLFAAVYQRAANQLLDKTELDPDVPLTEQLAAGIDAHIDYFVANRNTILAANRTLGGDPVVQAIIDDELDVLRRRMVEAAGLDRKERQALSGLLIGWLAFSRTLTVEWLINEPFSRERLRDIQIGALLGALGEAVDLNKPPADPKTRSG